MIRLILVLALALALSLEAGAQTFPTPGPGHVPWTAIVGGGGGSVASCTNGVDCYCDRATGNGPLGTSDPAYNAAITICEDWDDPAFRATTGADNWVDGSGGNRGGDSLFADRYGNSDFGGLWANGQPASPTLGIQCSPGVAYCTGMKEWDEDDRWQANALEPWLDIIDESSDFTAEDPTAGTPTIDGTAGQTFFGNALMAYRNGPGTPTSVSGAGGIINSISSMGSTHTQLGYAALWGYDAKVKDYDILVDAWKHDEVRGVVGGATNGLLGFRSTGYDPVADQGNERYTFPFHFFIFTQDHLPDDPPDNFQCSTAIASASMNGTGRAYCDLEDNLQVEASISNFDFRTDWDLGKHHCVSFYWDFRNIASVTAKAWLDGELVINLTGLNFTNSMYDSPSGADGASHFVYNNYSNRSGLIGEPWTTPRSGVNRRYSDNVTITNSTPQLCSKIGFPSSYNQAGL